MPALANAVPHVAAHLNCSIHGLVKQRDCKPEADDARCCARNEATGARGLLRAQCSDLDSGSLSDRQLQDLVPAMRATFQRRLRRREVAFRGKSAFGTPRHSRSTLTYAVVPKKGLLTVCANAAAGTWNLDKPLSTTAQKSALDVAVAAGGPTACVVGVDSKKGSTSLLSARLRQQENRGGGPRRQSVPSFRSRKADDDSRSDLGD